MRRPPGIRPMVRRRSHNRCEICGRTLASRPNTPTSPSMHHRLMQRMGGTDSIVNLLHVCLYCHRVIHRSEIESTAYGWIAWVDPAVMPVFLHGRFWAALSEDGVYERMEAWEAHDVLSWVERNAEATDVVKVLAVSQRLV